MSKLPPKRKGPPPPKPKFMQQDSLFSEKEVPTDWQREWVGMPEFVSEDMAPFKSIQINFNSVEDIAKFAELLGQKGVTITTRSTWFPKAPIDHNAHIWYIDGGPSRHYHEWQKPTTKLAKDFPRRLPLEIEEKVLGYESCMDVLEKFVFEERHYKR